MVFQDHCFSYFLPLCFLWLPSRGSKEKQGRRSFFFPSPTHFPKWMMGFLLLLLLLSFDILSPSSSVSHKQLLFLPFLFFPTAPKRKKKLPLWILWSVKKRRKEEEEEEEADSESSFPTRHGRFVSSCEVRK